MTDARQIKLRPVTPADDAFLLSVYASTRADELKLTPWTPEQKQAFVSMQFAAQKRHYAALYPGADHDVIYAGETAVGRVYLDRTGEAVHILDITLLPEYRGRGTGAALLRRLLEEAGANGKAVTVYVESFNPSLAIFEHLGFRQEHQDGFQLLMKWQPEAR
jgi:ribosomal protein S18 acetylase RimI-like enzyme